MSCQVCGAACDWRQKLAADKNRQYVERKIAKYAAGFREIDCGSITLRTIVKLFSCSQCDGSGRIRKLKLTLIESVLIIMDYRGAA